MRRLLEANGIRLTRSLGQSFMHDRHQLDRIVRTARVVEGDRVWEIGPGLGPLTERLAAAGARVLAVEKDRRLAALAAARLGGERVEIQTGDGLAWARDAGRDWTDWKCVSNLPYSVASPILVELALRERAPKEVVAVIQWEVGQRLCAGPGGKDYGILTLLVQLKFEACLAFRVPAACFFPEPKVDSACVRLERRAAPLLDPPLVPQFVALVKRAFSQRRKMMMKLLKPKYSARRLTAAFDAVGLSGQIRAEQVGLAAFVELTRRLSVPE